MYNDQKAQFNQMVERSVEQANKNLSGAKGWFPFD